MATNTKKQSKKTGGTSGPIVINQIHIRPLQRTTLDIGSWRQALLQADRGRMRALFDLYEDILIDMTLTDAIDKRIEAITNSELVFRDKTGMPVPQMEALIDTEEFEDLLKEIMNAKFWGRTLVEFDFTDGFNFSLIPRKNVKLDTKEILIDETDDSGVSYAGSDFYLEVGKPGAYGMIYKAAPYVIYKRGGFGDWAQYAEIFGMPFRVGKYNNYDEATRLELIKALENAGSAAVAVIPKEGDIEYKDNKSTGDGALYDRLRTACNEEILIGILGQTMTTLNGSSKSQGEVHLEVQENKHKSDRRFVQRILNHKLVPILEKRGYPVTGGFFLFPESGESVTLTERMELTERAAKMVDVPEYYVYETFGIPKPEKNDKVVRLSSAPQPPGPEGPDDPDDPDDLDDPEAANDEMGIFARLVRFFVGAPEAGASGGNRLTAEMSDEPGDDFGTLLLKRVARGEAGYFDAQLFAYTAGEFRRALAEGLRGGRVTNVGIEYGAVSEAVMTAMETNLFHFSAAKTLAQVQQLNEIYRRSGSLAEFMQQGGEVADMFNKTWARAEYETAGLIAESTATYHRLAAQTETFPYWEYMTVGDDRVRPEHVLLDGLILPANDPRWKKIYPPNGWKCRCYIVPRMRHEVEDIDFVEMRARVDAFYDTKEFKNADAQGFGVNRALTNEVFTENQFYIRKFPGKAAKYLDQLGPADYGLRGISNYIRTAVQKVPEYGGTAGEWFTRRQAEGMVLLEDYNGRRLALSSRTFRTHTTGKYEGRVAFLDSVPQVVQDPDEVWINNLRRGQPYDNYTMLKYYQDGVMIVCSRLEGGSMNNIKTWFPLTLDKKIIGRYRRGLLIHKKASD